MSSALNVIKAHFGSLREVTTAPVWQYNYGQKLEIDGIPNLPSTFEIHYSNSKSRGTAKRWIGYNGVVDVLDEYFRSGADIWGFIFLHEGEDDGETEYVIHIPVKERSEAEDSEPTPMQRDIVDEAIAALNTAVTQTGQDVISADESAQAAAQSATDAQTAAQSAQGSATSASASASTASTAAATATQKASEAATSAANAASAKTAAETAETNAKAAQTASESAQASAESATRTAAAKASEAATSATSASGSASAASASASQASESATSAANSATAASGSATSAATSASTASTKASEASASATAANTAKTAAQTAQSAAETAAATFETDTTLTVAGKAADAKAVGDAIGQTNGALSELDAQINGYGGGTKDVTSTVDWVAGGGVNALNGNIVTNITTYSHADIPLENATHVSGHTRAGLEPEKGMCFLDANKSWISGYYNQGGSSYGWNYEFDVPSTAKYLRICCATNYLSGFSCILTLPGNDGLVDRVEALEENPPVSDYEDLTSKPSVNSVTLVGDKTLSDLGIASQVDVSELEATVNGGEIPVAEEIPLSDFSQDNFRITATGYWASQSNGGYYMQLPDGVLSVSIKANASHNTMFAFLSAYSPVNAQKAPVVGNSGNPSTITAGETETWDVPDTATYIWISRQHANGYNTSPQLVKFTSEGVIKGISENVNEILNGSNVEYTGSYYQTREGDFKAGSCWRLLLTNTTADYVEIKALTDASDTSTAKTQFILYKDKEALWSPLEDFEAIKYGVNGSCTLAINDCSSIYDGVEHKVFYCGASRKYTKLIDAIAAAEQYMGSILYVDAGTYDLVSEFGSDYFDGISAGGMHGVSLKNRIHIIFSPNSYVTCHYTGTNPYVLEDFAAFNCGQYGFTIENLNLSSSRVRYAIHDERNGKTEECISKYINCKITHDNTDNEQWHSYSVIGGGLGSNHEVYIENCVFESVVDEGTTVHGCVSYHPSNDSANHSFAAKLTVKDNYFVTGTLELSGARTDASIDTVVIFTNNSVEHSSANAQNGIFFSGSQSYQGTHYDIKAWNNELRQAN